MKKSKSTKLLFSFLGLATFASLVGTVSGTLAWYAYNSRATLSYSGTSVSNTVALQIGIVSADEMPSISQIDGSSYSQEQKKTLKSFWDVMHEETFDGDDNHYYFAPAGKGLDHSVINAYLLYHGFATNTLPAVTSGSYTRGEELHLMNGPKADHPTIDTLAAKDSYAQIPFVFRVLDTYTTNPDLVYLPNKEVWLTNAKLESVRGSTGELQKAIRVFVDREDSHGDDYILNPTAATKGKTTVAGLLDLTTDHYYDYTFDPATRRYTEIIYGDYEKVGADPIKPSYSGPDEIDDINGTGKEGDNYDTFTARHHNGVYYYDSKTTGFGEYKLKTAEYESMTSIAPKENGYTGELSNYDENNPTSVCKTADDSGHRLGKVTLTIYLEGWDHSLIDQELLHSFNLGLTFKTNKSSGANN